MSRDKELIALINLIYEAALDSDLWPKVLIRLADAVGAAQVAMASMDRRANVVAAIAPRFDPDLLASWQEYWAFHDPVLARAILQPAGEIYTLDSLMPREEFASTTVFNEVWRSAHLSFAAMGANLSVEDQFSALICFSNALGNDSLTAEQTHIFESVLQHLTRAVRISRRLWELELKHVAATERLARSEALCWPTPRAEWFARTPPRRRCSTTAREYFWTTDVSPPLAVRIFCKS